MYNCIFSGHCIEEYPCSTSCPVLAQTSYLLERNEISMSNPVFRLSDSDIQKYSSILEQSEGRLSSVIVSGNKFTSEVSDGLTYCAICNNWKGSQLHATVFNLKFSQYIDTLKDSWSPNSDDSLEYLKIWIKNANVLIISNFDFITFKDFQSEALLKVIDGRVSSYKTTLIVTPTISSLSGQGAQFGKLTNILTDRKVGDPL